MLKSLILILFAILIAVSGQISLKYGVGQVGRIDGAALAQPLQLLLKVALNRYVVLGISFYALGAAIWIVVLSRVPLSFAYPMLGLSYVAVLFFSALVLREHVSLIRWAGVVLIVAGVALVGQTGDQDKASRAEGADVAGAPPPAPPAGIVSAAGPGQLAAIPSAGGRAGL